MGSRIAVTTNGSSLLTSNCDILNFNADFAVATGANAEIVNVGLATLIGSPGTFSAVAVNSRGIVTAGLNMTFTGDATGTASGANATLTLANSGVTAGTYCNVVVNSKGLITTGLNRLTVGTTAPTSPAVGDLWVDTN